MLEKNEFKTYFSYFMRIPRVKQEFLEPLMARKCEGNRSSNHLYLNLPSLHGLAAAAGEMFIHNLHRY